MLNNFFLIKEILKFLKSEISNFFIEEIFTQEKDKLVIKLTNKDLAKNKFIEFSCEDKNPYLLLKSDFKKARKNVVNLLERIYEQKIHNVNLYNDDRIIIFELKNELSVFFLFVKSKYNFLVIENRKIIDSFKNKKELIGESLENTLRKKETGMRKNIETVKDYYRSWYRVYGDMIFKEIIFLLKIKSDDKISSELKKLIDDKIEEVSKKFDKPEYLLYKCNNEYIPSLLRMNHLEKNEVSKFENINDLIQAYLKSYYNKSVDVDLRKVVLTKKENHLINLEKKYNSMVRQLEFSKKSNQFKFYGDLILSNIHSIKKGDESLMLDGEDFPDKVKIVLKKNLSPSENAIQYYEKYKKQKNSIEIVNEKISILKNEIDIQKNAIEEIKNNENLKSLKMIEKEIKKEDETSRFRKFILDEKFEVWVGKDSASNDLLTTRYSSQNDLWFHVRGASGSHTVLKISEKKNPPDKKIIEKAASIAAYYSKARNASNVPVAYCEKKYVKKKKGYKEGSVVMEREKVIFVKPGLPESLN